MVVKKGVKKVNNEKPTKRSLGEKQEEQKGFGGIKRREYLLKEKKPATTLSINWIHFALIVRRHEPKRRTKKAHLQLMNGSKSSTLQVEFGGTDKKNTCFEEG